MIGDWFFESFESRKLLQPPFPFFGVDSSQALICTLPVGKAGEAAQRCIDVSITIVFIFLFSSVEKPAQQAL